MPLAKGIPLKQGHQKGYSLKVISPLLSRLA